MKKKDNMGPFIGEGVKLEGKLKFTEPILINGCFEGDILDGSMLFVGKNAVIKGDIHVSSLVIEGEIHGNIMADNKVEVCPSGKVFGNIQAPTAVIDEKAVLVGNCRVFQPNELSEIKRGDRIEEAQTADKGSDKLDMESTGLESSPPGIDKTPAHSHGDKDKVEQFLKDCCETSPENEVQAQTFFQAYRKWSESNGNSPLSVIQFGKAMTERFEKIEISGKRFYKGVVPSIHSE
ncbi:MAG: hypothetical protein GY864_14850 [Desulfobacterales bacterium]|nr:hypothetical protein [Desulfobacterales bacterium]